ncbi:hypothetical protein [uncultured Clostridium sp.]|uniref:hypothetical protein n=1 Tax=uncultured Clostridium sp. TaxID=59620 RepID=UPI002593A713|nr:hypothetical protein [uncultured Clostridium sp.]
MDKEKEFIIKYEEEKEFLLCWGEYIKNYIVNELKSNGKRIEIFLRVPLNVNLKSNNSIIEKAFYRGKNYSDPLKEITDKVRLRVVVLLLDEIKIIKGIIESCALWKADRDKDFEKERIDKPTVFEYQSIHYVLRAKSNIEYNGCIIPEGTPCELQIRTLLQHAYSELAHDTVYKPQKNVNPNIYRLVARSMAMIETTDNIFEEVSNVMNEEKKYIDALLPTLNSEYETIAHCDYNEGINETIIEYYADQIRNVNVDDLKKFINENRIGLNDQILNWYDTSLLFRQPIVLLMFYLVKKSRTMTRKIWPFTDDLLDPIYTALGFSINKD